MAQLTSSPSVCTIALNHDRTVFARRLLSVFFLFSLMFLSTIRLRAQEQQVAFDSSGTLLHIDNAQAERLHIFTEYLPFTMARLFLEPDSSFVLEFSTERQDVVSRRRIAQSALQVQQLRQLIKERQSVDSTAVYNQEGRSDFMITSVAASLLVYAPAMLYLTDARDVSATAVTYCVGGVGGVLIPYLLTEHHDVTKGQAALARLGLELGVVSTSLIAGTLRADQPSIYGGGAIIGGVAGTLLGMSIAEKSNMSEGRAVALGSLTTDFLCISNGLLSASGAYDHLSSTSGMCALELGLTGISVAAAAHVSTWQNFSGYDARIMAIPSYLGGLLGAGILSSFEMDDEHNSPLIMTACYSIGSYVGWQIVRDHDFKQEHYLYCLLGTLGGGMLGAAADLAFDDRHNVLLVADLGAIGGYLAACAVCSPKAPAAGGSSLSVDFSINPQGINQAVQHSPTVGNYAHASTPLAGVQLHF